MVRATGECKLMKSLFTSLVCPLSLPVYSIPELNVSWFCGYFFMVVTSKFHSDTELHPFLNYFFLILFFTISC